MRRNLHGLCLALSLCTLIGPPPPGTRPQAPDVAALAVAEAAWERVVKRHVYADGRVDFDAIAERRADLDTFVGFVWQASPESHPTLWPTRERALGFWIDAYNALTMYSVIASGIPHDLGSLIKRFRFFVQQLVTVGGREMSLRALENEIIRPLGEPRVHFALNCMARSCPRLPQTPFAGADVEAKLEREARRFLSEPRNLAIDHAANTATLSAIFEFFPEDFVASGGVRVFVNRYVEPIIPPDYELRYREYDWTINRRH